MADAATTTTATAATTTAASTTTAATTTAAATTAAAAAATAPNPGEWVAGIKDEGLRNWVTSKNYGTPENLANSAYNLEKLTGALEHVVKLPAGDDPAEWGAVYDRLGRPKTAAEYKIAVPEGADTKFADAAKETFHKLGITAKQAEALATWNNEFAAAHVAAQVEATKAAHTAEIGALKAEQGAGWDAYTAQVDKAAVALGIDSKALDALKAAWGPAGAMKHLHMLGSKLGTEGTFIEGNTKNGFQGYTQEQAKARLATLKADPAWAQKYLAGGAEERAEMARLQQIANPV